MKISSRVRNVGLEHKRELEGRNLKLALPIYMSMDDNIIE